MITVSGKCICDKCEERTGDIYRMVGRCTNCRLSPVLMIFRVGDSVRSLDCPACGNWNAVRVQRRAEDYEIPTYEPPLDLIPKATP